MGAARGHTPGVEGGELGLSVLVVDEVLGAETRDAGVLLTLGHGSDLLSCSQSGQRGVQLDRWAGRK